MGYLNHFNLQKYIDQFDLSVFIETGTAAGHGIRYALTFPFKSLYSIEYDVGLYNYCKESIKDSRLTLINATSKDGLEEIFLKNVNGPALIWSDAHFINAPTVGTPENFNSGEEILRYPLESELEVIKKYAPDSVIIIDDLRIYENGPFATGNLPEYINAPKNRNIDFVYDLFGDSHIITRDYSAEGYVILTPKE